MCRDSARVDGVHRGDVGSLKRSRGALFDFRGDQDGLSTPNAKSEAISLFVHTRAWRIHPDLLHDGGAVEDQHLGEIWLAMLTRPRRNHPGQIAKCLARSLVCM